LRLLKKSSVLSFIIFNLIFSKHNIEIINNSESVLTIKLSNSAKTQADLFVNHIFVGLPDKKLPNIELLSSQISNSTFPLEPQIGKTYDWIGVQKHKNLNVGILKINPIINSNSYYKEIILKVSFSSSRSVFRQSDNNEKKTLSNKIINWDIAKNWFLENEVRPRINIANSESGDWIIFDVKTDGIKHLSYNQLKRIYMALDDHDPRTISIYTNPTIGRAKSQETNVSIQENLIELPILFIGEEDGAFDPGDKIIFYAQGPSGFDINENLVNWSQNLYFNNSKYWLFIPDDSTILGKRISVTTDPNQIELTLDYGISYMQKEIDLVNPALSGLKWYGPTIKNGSTQIISTNTPNGKLEVDSYVELKIKGNSLSGSPSTYHSVELYANMINQNKIGNTISWSGSGERTISGTIPSQYLNQINNNFFVSNLSSDNNSSPLIDYLYFRYGRKLIFNSKTLEFFSPIQNTGLRFSFLNELSEDCLAFDISSPHAPKQIKIKSDNKIEVQSPENSIGRYIIFNKNAVDSVDNLVHHGNITFSKLRNFSSRANYIIIGPEQFAETAQPLVNLRQPAVYANLEDIYIEFSGGNKDPMAIRSFLQWTQENWASPAPIHLLLLGDAGYDYRDINGLSAIVVPTIQVQSFISYPSDDRLATIYGNIPELSIGRFPAKNISQVEDFIKKIEYIESNNNFGPWRQKVTLIADDPARPEPNHGGIATGKSHTLNSESLYEIIPSKINVDKIYMLEYPEVSDGSAYGVTKPDATEAVYNALKNGTGIINYIGHGSAFQLAQEKLLYLNRGDLEKIKTNKKLPLWIVGTCSFGHFDDPLAESFGEELIRYPMDAASAVISTCRPITVTGNERYTQDIFENLFPNGQVTETTVGICLQSIKNGSSESEYFHLFGDPALKIPISFNSFENATVEPETLKTLGTGVIKFNQDLIKYNGAGTILLKDANRNVTRTYDIASSAQTLSYELPGATLFRGNFSFSNEENSIQIRVPQDISYSGDASKILIYLHDDEQDIISEISSVFINGGDATLDISGPIIEFISGDGRLFQTGDHKKLSENIIIQISDPIGINLTKELGHSIILKDLNTNSSYDVTDDFIYNVNSITTGKISLENYVLSPINLIVSAWDNANNPSEKEILLYSASEDKIRIYNAFNFPNPFSNQTKFTFELSSNAQVLISIYTVGGKKIKRIDNKSYQQGFHQVDWNGRNQFGSLLANGVYIYKIIAKNSTSSTSHIGKIAINR